MDGVVRKEVQDCRVKGNVRPSEDGGKPVPETLGVLFVCYHECAILLLYDTAEGRYVVIDEALPENIDSLPSMVGVSD